MVVSNLNMKFVGNSKHGRKKDKIVKISHNPIKDNKLKKKKKKLKKSTAINSFNISETKPKSSLKLKSMLEKRKEKKNVSFNLPENSSDDGAKIATLVSLKSENKKTRKNNIKSKEKTSSKINNAAVSKQLKKKKYTSDVNGVETEGGIKRKKKKRKKINTASDEISTEVDNRFNMPDDKDSELCDTTEKKKMKTTSDEMSTEVDHRFNMLDDEPMETLADELNDSDEDKPDKKARRLKPGIIYLSSIPDTMTPQTIRQYFEFYGKVGRSYIQPLHQDVDVNKKKKVRKHNPREKFSEGWLEFKCKKVARAVGERLNNTPVGGGKRKEYHDMLWNIKYLPRFKWTHLRERLEYERMVHNQRMRTEIAQVKKETEHYMEQVQKQKRMSSWEEKKIQGLVREGENSYSTAPAEFKQSAGRSEGREAFSHVERDDVLKSVFGL